MFTYSRRLIAMVGVALTFGLFSTSVVPVISGSTGHADAKKKKATKKVNRTKQS